MKKIFALLLSCILVFSLCSFAFAKNPERELKFGADGKFTILHLTDSQDDHFPAWEMLNLVKKSIEESSPDLIIFTGDIVEDRRIGDMGIDGNPLTEGVCEKDIKGDVIYGKTLENIKLTVKALFDVLESSGVPYVITQGNNDGKCGISNNDWLEIYSQYPNCIVKDMSNDLQDRIDSNLVIYDNDNTPAFNLWLMDTAGGGVSDEQISWYKNRCKELKEQNGGEIVPSLVFQHIQVAEIGNLFEECKTWDEGARPLDGKFYRLNKKIAKGEAYFAYEPGKTSEQFIAWKECGDVLGAFFGHQHIEGFSGIYEGIELGFTYGCQFAKTGPYGYRVITLNEDDILNYDNELFVYSGKVKLGTDKTEKIEYKLYAETDNAFSAFMLKIKNLLNMFSLLFKRLFS